MSKKKSKRLPRGGGQSRKQGSSKLRSRNADASNLPEALDSHGPVEEQMQRHFSGTSQERQALTPEEKENLRLGMWALKRQAPTPEENLPRRMWALKPQIADIEASLATGKPLKWGPEMVVPDFEYSRKLVDRLLPDFPPNKRVLILWFDPQQRHCLTAEHLQKNRHEFEVLPSKLTPSSKLERLTIFTDRPKWIESLSSDDRLIAMGMKIRNVKPRETERDQRILQLHKEGKSYKEICAILKEENTEWDLSPGAARQAMNRLHKKSKS